MWEASWGDRGPEAWLSGKALAPSTPDLDCTHSAAKEISCLTNACVEDASERCGLCTNYSLELSPYF